MEIVIMTNTEHLEGRTTIQIDNSTDHKDFLINQDSMETIISLNKVDKTLRIGGLTLRGREVELFKEFINQ
jgi:hypothetical protein